MDFATKAKLITAIVLSVLMGVVVLQNTEPVETRVLFMTFTLPRAALLLITLLTGIVLGILFSLTFKLRSGKKRY